MDLNMGTTLNTMFKACPPVKIYLIVSIFAAIVYYASNYIKEKEFPGFGQLLSQLCMIILCMFFISGLCNYSVTTAWVCVGLLTTCAAIGVLGDV